MNPPAGRAAITRIDSAGHPHSDRGPTAARNARRLAWAAWGASLVLTGLGLGLLAASIRTPINLDWGFRGYTAILAVAYSTVGAMITSRRPDHRIGCSSAGWACWPAGSPSWVSTRS